jgi:A/G-specific adenine glycosylase
MHIKNINLSNKILSWYDNNKRILPWRISKKSPKMQYYRLLSEFMLQQTQVKTVIPYFKNFVKEIPNLKALSKSSQKKVLKLWEGLGYYRRAKNLHKTSKIIIKKYKNKIPHNFDKIKMLPGIGDYTANILLALIYNQSRIGIDGNVKRVFQRLFNRNIEKINPLVEKEFLKYFSNTRNSDIAEALMEFGAIICKPKDPQCNICVLKKKCKFFKKKDSNIKNKSFLVKEMNYDIFCYLKKQKKQIALTKNKDLSFLKNFNIPQIKISHSYKIKKNNKWNYLCNYKNNISNIKMNINLFYKFTKNKPKNFKWHYTDRPRSDFIPSFTRQIIKKVDGLYIF